MKKSIIITLFLCLLMIGSVSAASDTNDTLSSDVSEKVQAHTDTHQIDKASNDDIIDEDVKTDEKTKTSTNNLIKEKDTEKLSSTKTSNQANILKETGETKSFTDLKDSISGNVSNNNYEITLEHDYKYNNDNLADGIIIKGSGSGGITIGTAKTLVIKGNGKTIDANGKARLFWLMNNVKLQLENLTITNCNATYGGVIHESNGVTLTIINCTLKNNIATGTSYYGGGAIYIDYSTLIVINSTLENNTAYSGGAIHTAFTDGCTVSITNSTFNNNTATSYGGAINIYDWDTLFLTYSTLQNNKAESGSAIYWEYGNGNNIQYNTFIDNQDNLHSVNINIPTNNKFLTMPIFEIGHISDFVNGDSIKITVSEKNGITDELKINLTIGTEIYAIKLKNGIGEKTITPNLNPGTYKAILNFTETDKYASTSAESNEFQIKPKIINPNIKIENIPNFEVGQEIIIHITADNTFNNELNITINGTQYPITITNGYGSTRITPNLKPGEYNATINYPGDEIYPPITVTSNKFRVRNITELLDTINQLQLKINELIEVNETLNKNITVLQGQINDILNNNITQLKNQINELIKANETLNKNITTLQNKINELEKLQTTIDNLENQISNLNINITKLENKINELEKLKTNITLLKDEITDLKLNNTKLLEKINLLNTTLEDQNVTKLQDELRELKNIIKQLEIDIAELVQNNITLNANITKLQNQINQLIQNNITLNANITKLQNQINELLITNNLLNQTIKNQNYTLKNELNNATNKIDLLEGKLIILENKLIESNNKIIQLQTIINQTTPTNNQNNISPTKVTKKSTKIIAKKKTYKTKTKIKKYKITLKSGKKRVPKVRVYIKIKGKKYKKTFKTKTNKKSIATFKIKKLTRKGKYKGIITFKGNKKYNASKRTVKIIVK